MASQNPILFILTGGTSNPEEQTLNNNVSAHTNPSFITAVENPIIWKLKASGTTGNSAASIYILNMNSSNLPNVGEYFILSGDSTSDYPSYQFTSADEPKVNEFYSNTTVPSKTAYEIADSIVYTMNENVSFRQRFYALIASTNLTTTASIAVIASNPGTRYNLNLSDPDSIFVSNGNFDGTDSNRGQTLKDYCVFADVYVGSTVYGSDNIDRVQSNKVSSIEISYNPANEYTFDVSNIVKNYIFTPLPTVNTGLTHTTDCFTSVYLMYGEKYDEFDNGYRRRFIVGQTMERLAYNGSLDKLHHNSLSAYTVQATSSYTALTQSALSYLTNSPSVLQTFSDQKQFLSVIFWNLDPLSYTHTWQLRGRYTKVDGSGVNYTGFTANQSTWGKITANVTMNELEIPTSGILHYTCALYLKMHTGAYVIASPIKTFKVLNEQRYVHSKEIHWLNPLGDWDSWVFNGEIEEQTKRRSEEFSINASNTPSPTDALDKVIDIEVERQITINSGWLDKDHSDWLFELAKSEDVRLFEDNIEKAIIVIDVDHKPSTEDDMYNVSLTFRFAKTENILSN